MKTIASQSNMKVDTLAKHVLFCTIRITNNKKNGKVEVGTGFLFNASESPLDPAGTAVPLLVSNKHVFADAAVLRLDFLLANADNSGPELGQVHGQLNVGPAATDVIGHPDPKVDVAVKPLGDSIQLILDEKQKPYLPMLNWGHIPSDATVENLDVLEELVFIGYPNGWADPVHHTPIMRNAITATPVAIPFGGEPTFLLDGSVFGGSSGSPVFILDRGSWTGHEGLMLGDRIHLVGVVGSTLVRNSQVPLQAAAAPFIQLSQELNLGVAYSYKAITATINHFLSTQGLATGTGTS
ncbi:trypsin-like peptidase domain-containing protein [Mycobacterium sp.]|uniref:trypsin-like peptidase domain-containing protein n=1 Tax=Mycobacterium sp. TaxID=1785 RepID=UPI003F9ADB8B